MSHIIVEFKRVFFVKYIFLSNFNSREVILNANIFAATHLKPFSLMRKVNMLDILTGGVIR